jgi:F-type H+-transporting ATPase subunit b
MINWWTLIFEVVNFLIIVAVLYRLLYKPLRRMIREREERIDGQKRAAAEAQSDAEARRQEYEAKLQQLADEEKATLDKARARADEEAQAILQKARDQARATRDAATRRIERQVEEGVAALRDQVGRAALAMAGQVAGGLDAEAVHTAALAEVDRLLGEVPEDERHRAGQMLRENKEPVHVASASTLNEDHRGRLAEVLRKHLGLEEVTLEVAEQPDLIAGLEIRLKNLLVKAHWRDRLERFIAQSSEEKT